MKKDNKNINRHGDYSLVGKDSALAVERGLADAKWFTPVVSREKMRALLVRRDGTRFLYELMWSGEGVDDETTPFVMGLIDAESVNGDIEMDQVESGDVDASSVNGSVVFDGPFQPRGRYRLVSHNGNLRVGVPVGADVDVSVSAFHGGFESGIPLLLGPHDKGRRFTFTLGGGGSSLELQSFQGLIQLLRSEGLPVPPHAPAPPAAPAAPQENR